MEEATFPRNVQVIGSGTGAGENGRSKMVGSGGNGEKYTTTTMLYISQSKEG